jgi:hypothetical protein
MLLISPLLPAALGGLLAIGCLIGAFHALWRKRAIDDNPTSKTHGVFIGLTEVKGTAETEAPLTSHLGGVRCVQYSWNVQEHWSRTVTETHTDAQGRTHTRTRTESGWKTVANGGESVPFYVKDETGVVRVVPEGARMEGKETFDETCNRSDPLYYARGPASAVANSTHRRRFQENAIPLHAMLYVVGQARQREDIVAAEIARDRAAPLFVISTRTEKQVSRGFTWKVWLWAILGLVVSLGAALVWGFLQPSGRVTFVPFLIAFLGFLIAVGLGWVWTAYNSVINLHHRVQQGWSQVDVQLKRRNDLIPNLVQTVEGYRGHERDTQTVISELRAQLAATPPGVSGPDFKGLSTSLRAVIERYPDLKASESFLKLQNSLVDTEQRIALARDYFNDIATFYNTRLETIPDRWVGALARLRPRMLMSAADFERAPVTVKLAD